MKKTLLLNFKNFDELYNKLNKDIILNPNEYVESLDLCSAYLPFTLIEIDSSYCNLDFKDLFYNKNKWNSLIRTYIDLGKLICYKQKIDNVKGTSYTFYFNQIKKQIGGKENNGPCLISFTLTRKNRSSDWEEMNIYYRTCELGRRFGADLILFSVLIRELNKNIKKIRLVISKPYFSTMTACGLINKLDINLGELKEENKIQKSILHQYKIMSNKEKISNYSSRKKVQEIVLGIKEYESLKPNNLSIIGDLL